MHDHSPVWINRPEKGSLSAIRLMAWASFFFGRNLTRPVIYLIALFYLVFAASARKASKQYLRHVLGHSPSLKDQYKHFLYFSTVTHDRLYMLAGRFKYFEFSISGEPIVRKALNTGSGLMLYGAHFGSFEAVRFTARTEERLKISLLMYEDNGRKLLDLLRKISPEFSESIIPLGSITTMIEAKERLEKGHMIGLLADRSVNDESGKSYVFLGQSANFPDAPFKLQRLFKCPALFITGIYLGANRYEIKFIDLLQTSDPISSNQLQASYVDTLEQMCLTHPFNWFNFYDFWDQPR